MDANQAPPFNPLGNLDPESPDFHEQVAAIADAIILAGGSDEATDASHLD